MENSTAVLILAAGKGTRMKSELPKVMHRVMGRSILEHVLNAAKYLEPKKLVVVTGHRAELVEASLADWRPGTADGEAETAPAPITFVRQTEQLGTGHAVAMAKDALADHKGPLLIMAGDVPLISPQTLLDLVAAHKALKAKFSVLSVKLEDPARYGRIVRDENGWLEKIVEARDASEAELALNEINSGFYVAESDRLFEAIDRLSPDNDQKEYYLTDVVADFRAHKLPVAAVEGPDPLEVSGINDRYELAAASAVLKDRINAAWMRAGVGLHDPISTYIEEGVRLGRDVLLWPGVVVSGRSVIADGAEIGPHCHIHDSRVGRGARIGAGSAVNGADVPEEAELPPLSLVRPDAKPRA